MTRRMTKIERQRILELINELPVPLLGPPRWNEEAVLRRGDVEKRTIVLRDYQEKLVQKVTEMFESGEKKVCLAAAPSGGKTQMSMELINRMTQEGKRVLVLAHGTNTIRENYVDRLKQYEVDFNWVEWRSQGADSQSAYDQITAPVVVTIPQSLKSVKKLGTYDLVVVDEAHEFYDADMVQKIIRSVGKPRVLLLTGTPARFIADKVPLVSMSSAELIDLGILADLTIEIGTSGYDFSYDTDYNVDNDLIDNIVFDKTDTEKTLDNLLEALIVRIKAQDLVSEEPSREEIRDIHEKVHAQIEKGMYLWAGQIKKIGKTMISCRSIEQANQVLEYFKRKNVSAVVSHSEGDPDSSNMRRFKEDPNILGLIVVYRGTLGYDYEDMANAVDLTGSFNVNRIFQLLCRVLRKSATVPNKLFLKLAPKGKVDYTVVIMSLVCQLGASKSFYEEWDGRLRPEFKVLTLAPKKDKDKDKDGGDDEGPTSPPGPPNPPKPKPVAEELVLMRGWMGLRNERRHPYSGCCFAWLKDAVEKLRGVTMQDPQGNKAKIKLFFETHNRLPSCRAKDPIEKRLWQALKAYCTKSSGVYDPEFHAWARSVGYGKDTSSEKKTEIKLFFETHNRLPSCRAKDPIEKRLWQALKAYCTKSSGVYDPEFHAWARSVGYGMRRKTTVA